MFSKQQNNHNTFTVVDTTAPLDFFKDNGYYTVGNKIFNNRLLALQEASQTNKTVSWHFNDEVFSQLDWSSRPGVNINELYRLRAQQLREKYEYLIVAWSGGADSTTIIDTFLNNNILLDEIVIAWPVSQTRGKYTPNSSLDPTNMNSEWDYAIQPKLDKIASQFPHVKITICDYMAELDKNVVLENLIDISPKYSYTTLQKYEAIDKILQNRCEKYKNTACIFGSTPIDVILLDDTYLAAIHIDTTMHSGPKSDYARSGYPRRIELFYSSPDLPEIMIEQAHLIYDYFNKNPHLRHILSNLSMQKDRTFKLTRSTQNELFRHIRKGLVYPTWDLKIFQVNKPTGQTKFNQWYDWFYSNPHSYEYTDKWLKSVLEQEALIDSKYCVFQNGQITDFKSLLSKLYPIKKFQSKDL